MKKARMKTAIFVCDMDSPAGDLRGKTLTYERVKTCVLAAGRFSIFEATRSKKAAQIYTRLNHDPELEVSREGYPWLRVRRVADGVP